MKDTAKLLILPGIYNSGEGHWQTLWEGILPNAERVQQRDWNHPECAEWVVTLEQSIQEQSAPVILIAHSLGCLTVAHWAAQTQQRIQGALLVAVPDPAGTNFPSEAKNFAPVPLQKLPFKSLIVASSNDPYGSVQHAQTCAQAWGSELVNIGDYGHINAASGLGVWADGLSLLAKLDIDA